MYSIKIKLGVFRFSILGLKVPWSTDLVRVWLYSLSPGAWAICVIYCQLATRVVVPWSAECLKSIFWKRIKKTKMSWAVKPYRLIDIVKVRHVVTVCNCKGDAFDIAISLSESSPCFGPDYLVGTIQYIQKGVLPSICQSVSSVKIYICEGEEGVLLGYFT